MQLPQCREELKVLNSISDTIPNFRNHSYFWYRYGFNHNHNHTNSTGGNNNHNPDTIFIAIFHYTISNIATNYDQTHSDFRNKHKYQFTNIYNSATYTTNTTNYRKTNGNIPVYERGIRKRSEQLRKILPMC